MSNFFKNSDLMRKDADEIVSETLKNCDDGELYLEESKSESILLDDNKIKSSNYSSDLGFGFRAISDEVVAYSYSNEISNLSTTKPNANIPVENMAIEASPVSISLDCSSWINTAAITLKINAYHRGPIPPSTIPTAIPPKDT